MALSWGISLPTGGSPSFYCPLCEAYPNTPGNFMTHLGGKTHARKVRNMPGAASAKEMRAMRRLITATDPGEWVPMTLLEAEPFTVSEQRFARMLGSMHLAEMGALGVLIPYVHEDGNVGLLNHRVEEEPSDEESEASAPDVPPPPAVGHAVPATAYPPAPPPVAVARGSTLYCFSTAELASLVERCGGVFDGECAPRSATIVGPH